MAPIEIGDTIALVNVVLERFGKPMISELPNATYGDPTACLLYRALVGVGATGVSGDTITFASERQAAVVAQTWGVDYYGETVKAPSQFRSVIGDFDGDRLPHYNIDR